MDETNAIKNVHAELTKRIAGLEARGEGTLELADGAPACGGGRAGRRRRVGRWR